MFPSERRSSGWVGKRTARCFFYRRTVLNKGYMGKVLLVDLGKGTISVEEIPDSVYEHYLAGEGLGAYLLYKWIPAGADPLGPENVLGFLPGLLTGTGSLFSGR